MLILRKKAWIGIKPINKLKTGFPMAKILVINHLLVLTVGFLPSIPNLNEFLHHVNGLGYPWDYLKMLHYKNLQPKCLAIKSVLVLPEYWGSGVSLMLFSEMLKRAKEKGYTWADLSLTSEDNPKTPMLAERLGGKLYKRYRLYQIPL